VINVKKQGSFQVSIIVVTLLMIIFSSNLVMGQEDTFDEINAKLVTISDDEKEVLQRLFILTQEIEALEKREKKLTKEIEIMNKEINSLEEKIKNEEIEYKQNLNILEKIIKSYQRKGLSSYLEMILDSENLTMLLQRINIIRDLTRGTGELLNSLEKNKEVLNEEKANLKNKIDLIQDNQEQLKLSIANKMKVKEEMENYLNSLAEKKEDYQEYLTNVKDMWNGIKPLFEEMIKEFSSIIEEGNISDGVIDIKLSIFGIKGTISEETFNNIIEENELLPEMTIDFNTDKATIYLHRENLILSGSFTVEEGKNLRFEATEGSFYDMPLESSSIEELFKDIKMTISLQSVLGDNTLSSVEIKDDKMVLTVIPKLF